LSERRRGPKQRGNNNKSNLTDDFHNFSPDELNNARALRVVLRAD
jgi:hypothetical protein